jgi:DNA polymerase-3 subunit gamma/tau
MTYEVTAIRKRPQTFDELVGQDFIVATLKSSILEGRIAHAYLFSGPRGVGKTSAARILSKALNCEKGPTDAPCGECVSCRAIARGNALDVIEIDGASNTSVNDVREIKDEVLFAPNSSRYKIYIIDEVHMLSNSAFNALLKTIEEPPPYIVFIFATTEVHKVPATIRSRCQQFNFRLISTDQIAAMLRAIVDEGSIPAEDSALLWIAKEATGSLRDAYTLLDQVMSFSRGAGTESATVEAADGTTAQKPRFPSGETGSSITLSRIRDKLGLTGVEQISRIGTIVSHGDKKEILEYTDEILGSGVSVEQLVADLTDYFRSLLFLKCGIQKRSLLSFSAQDVPSGLLDIFSAGQLEKAIDMLLELYRKLKYSLHPRFDLELVMCQLASLQDLILPSELLTGIRALKYELEADDRAVNEEERPRADRESPLSAGDEPSATETEGPPSRTASPSTATSVSRGGTSGARDADTTTSFGGEDPSADAGDAGTGGPDASGIGTTASTGAPGDRLGELADAVRKDRLALASSLAKADFCEIVGQELRLHYKDRDRFSGEQVLREKEVVLRRAQEVFADVSVARISVLYSGGGRTARDSDAPQNQIDIVKKIFRGEIVQGE